MLFTLVTVLAAAGIFLGLAFHRFRKTRAEARATILYAELAKMFAAWLALRTIDSFRRASPRAWWAYAKALPLWRLPFLERWIFIVFYGSLAYLAASGFFFAIFVPRGLYGYPLVGHVVAGGLFAAGLTLVVVFKARDFRPEPKPAKLNQAPLAPRRWGLTPGRVRALAFWLFVLAGFLLSLSALLPMLPLLHTPGQKLMFELHRYSALAAALAAAVFADLGAFDRLKPPGTPGMPR